MIFDSFGAGLALTSDDTTAINRANYTSVVRTAAHTLATRYSPVVGMVRSWGSIDDETRFEVIIDNLMNLELLLHVGATTRNATLTTIARSHARRTARLWLRADGSTAHLCVFSPTTGALLRPCTGTPQGYAANSTWARGQAWALYGLTMAHRYLADDNELLAGAVRAAEFFLGGGAVVPKWDFNAPPTEAYPDASAAAIAASGLLELSVRTANASYRDAAVKLVGALAAGEYLAPAGRSPAVLAACQHDCGAEECSLIESDYYLYEALRRLRHGIY